MWVRCSNIPPGTCCKPQPDGGPENNSGLMMSMYGMHRPHIVPHRISLGSTTFYGLRMQQFGAGWGATGPLPADIPDCNGIPILRTLGDNVDTWDRQIYNPPADDGRPETPERIVFAASWVDLRTRFPPNSAATRYLQWQGVQGAIWGKNTWRAESNGVPFGTKLKRRDLSGERLNGFATQGTVTIRMPVRWVFPDAYGVNGTTYTTENPAKGVYTSADGRVLDFNRNRNG
ncbi:MAG: hypothetical protein Q9181_007281 [Wetmoreana brouardii]